MTTSVGMDTHEVDELCGLVDDVMEGATDVKIVTTTPPDVVSNCVGVGVIVVGTTTVDVCCAKVVDAFEVAEVGVDADVTPAVGDADAAEELVCEEGDVGLVGAAELVDGAGAGLEVVAGAGPPLPTSRQSTVDIVDIKIHTQCC